jgi:hypothetical protein
MNDEAHSVSPPTQHDDGGWTAPDPTSRLPEPDQRTIDTTDRSNDVEFRVEHRTRIDYGDEVSASHVIAHLRPRTTATQFVETVTLTAVADESHVHVLDERVDLFANTVSRIDAIGPHRGVELLCRSTVRRSFTAAATPSDDRHLIGWWRADSPLLARSARAGAIGAELIGAPIGWTGPRVGPDGACALSLLSDLTAAVNTAFVFDPAATTVATPVDDVLRDRRGVCQDLAHTMIVILRSWGVAARYVSGYLETLAPPGQPRLVGVDASHAWVAALTDGGRWVEADPTNNLIDPLTHVLVAQGRDYSDVAPTRGVIVGPPTTQQITVSVDVTRATVQHRGGH